MKKNHAMQSLELIIHQLGSQLTLFKTEEETTNLIQKISNEKVNIYNSLQAQIFHAKQQEHTRLTVQAFYNTLIRLTDTTYHLFSDTPKEDSNRIEVLEYLSISLEELQQFIEVNYPQFLSPEERVPLKDLLVIKSELEASIIELPAIFKQRKNNNRIITVVMNGLQQFINRIEDGDIITVQEAGYHTEMVKMMLKPAEMVRVIPNCPSLHELLFYWNYNSVESITYFTSGLEALVEKEPTPLEKLEFLRLEFKRLLHLPVMPKVVYDKNYPSMKAYFVAWIKNEIDYLQQKIEGLTSLVDGHGASREKISPVKVLVALSADQIGLILRAADEARILVAKSLSQVFKGIVPHLSTPRKDDPSWENMRSRTYNPERREVSLAVDALEKMIAILKSY